MQRNKQNFKTRDGDIIITIEERERKETRCRVSQDDWREKHIDRLTETMAMMMVKTVCLVS